MSNKQVKSGVMLLAEPFLRDPYFKRSVVLLCRHDEDGSVGFILNKKLDAEVQNLIADFPEVALPIYYGGPVNTDTIHFLHRVGHLIDGMHVARGVYWGGDFTKLKALISNGLVTQDDLRFFIGFSGWGEGQLVEEMQHGTWVPTELDANYLFNARNNDLWQTAMEHKGEHFSVIARIAEGPNLN